MLWELEGTGLRVDRRARWRHAIRLRRKEEQLRREILGIGVVRAAVDERLGIHQQQLRLLQVTREHELRQANASRMEWERQAAEVRAARLAGDRSRTLKQLGKPPGIVRGSTYSSMISKLASRVEAMEGGFNPGAAGQKAWLLYEILKLPKQWKKDKRKGTQAITTDKNALRRLARRADVQARPEVLQVIRCMQEFESVNQIRTTFVAAPLRGGRIYSLYGLHRTATGRIASGADEDEKAGEAATNQQNWPDEVRDIIIPEDGCLLVQVDWSKVEWLLTLMFAGDDAGWEAALAGEDQHRRLAAAIYRVDYAAVTTDQRSHAKRATHGLNYGMGVQTLADAMGVGEREAKVVLQAFKDAFPIVAKWREAVVKQAGEQKYLDTPFGWRRWFWAKEAPEMIAFLPSATGADMLKARLPAMRECVAVFPQGRLLTTTHDSVLAECRAEVAEVMGRAMKAVFEKPFRTLGGRSFPAEVKIGKNWKEAS